MSASRFADFYAEVTEPLAVVLGTNEIASAVAVKLRKAHFTVILSHDPYPPVIRRGMAFHDALFDDSPVLQGVVGARAETAMEIADAAARRDSVAVTPLQLCDLLALRRIPVLIDARMQKRSVTPDFRYYVGLAVGLGPNFTIGENCDVAVETHPTRVGGFVAQGSTEDYDGAPRLLGGLGRERFVVTPRGGLWHTPFDVGASVERGELLGRIAGITLHAPMTGVLRGVARDGAVLPSDVKAIEVDPRGRRAQWAGLDPRGRAIAEATLAAIRDAQKRRKRAPPFAQAPH
ncbi:xanthine dehydrogenase [Rhodoblastus sp.]|uniref:xanthine dehydrogenase n=1 Tax=Rhodoblastus sp. TaxID=1962975 RepID=UPI0035AE18AE